MIDSIDEIGGLVTLRGASRASGYSEKQLRHLALAGTIKAKRLGGLTLLVEKRSLNSYARRARRERREGEGGHSDA